MNNICAECKHFRRHYIKHGQGYSALSYGHCVHPRLKRRDADTPSCEHFKQRQDAAVKL